MLILGKNKQLDVSTNQFTTVCELKRLVEQEEGIPVDWQFLRLASGSGGQSKPMQMNSFLLDDFHITRDDTVFVQVHPWEKE